MIDLANQKPTVLIDWSAGKIRAALGLFVETPVQKHRAASQAGVIKRDLFLIFSLSFSHDV